MERRYPEIWAIAAVYVPSQTSRLFLRNAPETGPPSNDPKRINNGSWCPQIKYGAATPADQSHLYRPIYVSSLAEMQSKCVCVTMAPPIRTGLLMSDIRS